MTPPIKPDWTFEIEGMQVAVDKWRPVVPGGPEGLRVKCGELVLHQPLHGIRAEDYEEVVRAVAEMAQRKWLEAHNCPLPHLATDGKEWQCHECGVIYQGQPRGDS